jgi:hypothetical protein
VVLAGARDAIADGFHGLRVVMCTGLHTKYRTLLKSAPDREMVYAGVCLRSKRLT